jgi:RNA polymerase sigma factor (sigma-70 family)
LLCDRSSLLWQIVYSYYPPRTFSHEDLAQSGVEALLRALPRYDAERTKFSTFAAWQIRCGITHEIRRSTWRKTAQDIGRYVIRLPEYLEVGCGDATADIEFRLAVRQLGPRRRFVIWATTAGYTLGEIGQLLGTTGEAQRQARLRAARELELDAG